ncbi:uncharacterized protein METZ01_LOCUS441482 [marine metagenome]|uniref:Uncharacterized protein n=1 Tax=marine metagenome TaxID=408172 RepID=A0A382Z1L6_9ZZZZ
MLQSWLCSYLTDSTCGDDLQDTPFIQQYQAFIKA